VLFRHARRFGMVNRDVIRRFLGRPEG